jgi:hypothetical protein
MHRCVMIAAVLATACATMGIPDGTLAIEETAAGNRRIEIEMVRMPAPEQYQPGATTFAVWIVRDDVALRAGELEYDYGSAVARGSVVTHYDDFRVVVTADREDSEEPGDEVVFQREIAA